MADFGGASIFGQAVTIRMTPEPSAAQINMFFGVTGVFSLWGGSRGRAFEAAGVLVAPDRPSVDALRAAFLSYDDGVGRVLTDTGGVAWPDVVFTGRFEAGEYQFGMGGVCLPYRAAFRGMV